MAPRPDFAYHPGMPDTLYDQDILTWSEQQASLLRRVANGERVNGVDWPNIAEEIEDVGSSILNAVRGLLRQAMVHLLKTHLFPNDPARGHWLIEADTFLAGAGDRFAPSMRQRIDLDTIWRRVRVTAIDDAGAAPAALPEQCPWSLSELLGTKPGSLLSSLAKPTGTP